MLLLKIAHFIQVNTYDLFSVNLIFFCSHFSLYYYNPVSSPNKSKFAELAKLCRGFKVCFCNDTSIILV
jgi:hypothetical protein